MDGEIHLPKKKKTCRDRKKWMGNAESHEFDSTKTEIVFLHY